MQNTTTNSYSPFYDFAGSGTITGVDGSYVRINSGDTLPATSPSIPSGGSGDAVAAGDPSGTAAAAPSISTVNPSASASQPAALSASPSELAFGGSSSLATLKSTTATAVSASPSNAAAYAAELSSVTGTSVPSMAALDLVTGTTPQQATFAAIQSIAEPATTTSAEIVESPRSITPWGVEIFNSSAVARGDGFIDDHSANVRDGSLDNGDELPSRDWLTDLVLEQELDWLRGSPDQSA